MDAGEEMRLLEENPASPLPGSPVPAEGLSSDDELMAETGDDVLDKEAQELEANRTEMPTPPLLENPESSMQPPRAPETQTESNLPGKFQIFLTKYRIFSRCTGRHAQRWRT